jgi:hypothetical protein
MLWLILFLLLALWVARFGFEAGGALISAAMAAAWLLWLTILMIKGRSPETQYD